MTAKVSGTAAVLFNNICAMLAGNEGGPVHVKNPAVIELINAGLLVETAPRETWTDGGVSHLMAVVKLPQPATVADVLAQAVRALLPYAENVADDAFNVDTADGCDDVSIARRALAMYEAAKLTQ